MRSGPYGLRILGDLERVDEPADLPVDLAPDRLASLLDTDEDSVDVDSLPFNDALQRYPLVTVDSSARHFLAVGDATTHPLEEVAVQLPEPEIWQIAGRVVAKGTHSEAGLTQIVWLQRGRFFNIGWYGDSDDAFDIVERAMSAVEGW